MKDTDKVYLVIVSPDFPHIEHEYLIRVPEGVEINEDILKKSWFFDDEWVDLIRSPQGLGIPPSRIECISEVNKELWSDDYPSLHKDGNIHYEDE